MLRPGFQQKNRLLMWDNFDRADNTVLGQSTSGRGWIMRNGAIGISNNMASQTAESSVFSLNSGFYDYRISYRITSFNFFGIAFRIVSGNTLFFLRARVDVIELYQGLEGVNTLLSSTSRTSTIGDTITAEVRGLEVKIYVNGEFLVTVTLPEHTQSFLVGLRGGGQIVNATLDNFVVEGF